MKLFAIVAAASLLWASGALAGPVLRSEVTVTTPIVTVGDMFDDPGILAEKALFRAPRPGTTGTVLVEDVERAAALVGLTGYTTEGVLRVRVTRAATVVDAAMLTDLITADLAARGIVHAGITVEARFDTPDPSFNAEVSDAPARLVSLRYTPGNGAFAARFMIAGEDAPVDLAGHLELMVEAPHLAATRPAGTVLTLDDIEMRPIPLRHAEASGAATLDQLVGKQLTRQSREGMLLRAADVTEPRVIERNALVTVVLSEGPMTLTVKGEALNSAAVGETVQVMNSVSRRILTGTALPNGAVAISSTINVAGL
ncbi:MAG TPA: flagellar basal body P-ring formation protein FlgA [Alphaproteobacteria bacterium]|nr:flagellar basal body P-ring formation protein FlgA [Alphaproteobacteria bacterium]